MPLPKADCKVRSKSRQRWNLPSFPHKQQHLHRAGMVACRSELLSHTIVFWAFCNAVDCFRGEITMEGYGSSRAGPPWDRRVPSEPRWPLCGAGPEEAHTAPRLENARLAAIFPFNSLQPLWEGVGYNIGERLHLMPFCVSLCCNSNFVQAFCYGCMLGDFLRAPFPHPQTSTEISTFLYASFSP